MEHVDGKRVGLQHFDEKSERKREPGKCRAECNVIVCYKKFKSVKNNLILQINISTNDVSHHQVDYKNIQKEPNVYSCTRGYKSRTLQM